MYITAVRISAKIQMITGAHKDVGLFTVREETRATTMEISVKSSEN